MQLNQPYQCLQLWQTMGSRLQMHIQNPVKHLNKKVNGFYAMTISTKHSILDVWQSSDYAAGLLKLLCHGSREIHGKTDICQTYIPSKLRTFPYSEVTHGSRIFKLKKSQWTIEFDVFVLCFVFFIPLSQTISAISRNGTCIKIVVHVLAWAHAIALIKWRRLPSSHKGKEIL